MLMPVRILAAIGLVIAVVLAPLAAAPPARAATHSVQIGDGFFSPANLTITVGDTVTWTNTDDSPHTVTATDGAFDAGNLDGGAAFSQTFTSAGTFAYVCSYHDEMTGTITVVAATQSGTGAAPPATTAAAPTAAAGATHAGGADAGSPPDTAVPTTGGRASWIGQLLIGLGLVALAFGLFPVRRLAPARSRTSAGWRR
jgi:plastocyanin